MEYVRIEGDSLVCNVRARKWHPGWWLFVARRACAMLWEACK